MSVIEKAPLWLFWNPLEVVVGVCSIPFTNIAMVRVSAPPASKVYEAFTK